jgi:hypothetical protein
MGTTSGLHGSSVHRKESMRLKNQVYLLMSHFQKETLNAGGPSHRWNRKWTLLGGLVEAQLAEAVVVGVRAQALQIVLRIVPLGLEFFSDLGRREVLIETSHVKWK